jgi:hypothetical protein
MSVIADLGVSERENCLAPTGNRTLDLLAHSLGTILTMMSWLLKINMEREVKPHMFLSLALNGDEWSASCCGHFTFWRKIPQYTEWIGG